MHEYAKDKNQGMIHTTHKDASPNATANHSLSPGVNTPDMR